MKEKELIVYLNYEFKDIETHRVWMSRQLGREVDIREATKDYCDNHAVKYSNWYDKHKSDIEKLCEERCPAGCKGLKKCILTPEEVHELLKR